MSPKCLLWVRRRALTALLITVLVVLLVAFVATMVCESAEHFVGCLLGLAEKNEVLQFLGIGMGGLLVALQVVMSHKRAKAMEDAAKAQASAAHAHAEANVNTERGQRQERLKNAIKHLGNESDSVRLGGAYELFHLAEDTDDLRRTALNILCAHIRRTTHAVAYGQEHALEPSEDVQSLLTLLFVEEHRVFEGLRAKLDGSRLNGARLASARLANASLRDAELRGAHLLQAELQGADLWSARLQDAQLMGAHLPGATLTYAKLQGAFLRDANLQGGCLLRAEFQNAHLVSAQLQGADLRRVRLEGADLSDAELHGARLDFAQLQGASLNGAAFQGVDSRSGSEPYEPVTQIRERTGRESDLSTVAFSGGLSPKNVEDLAAGVDDSGAIQLRARLEPHVGEPTSSKPPDGMITGAYTKVQAEAWITKYKKAVAERPTGEGLGRSR